MTLLEIFCYCYLVILLMLVMTSFFAFDIVPYANMHVKIQNSQGLPASHCEKRELPGAACLCV